MTDSELETLILLWRRWCFRDDSAIGPQKFRSKFTSVGSAERFWRSPQCWDAPEPRPDAPNEWEGLRVERAVQKLPERPRAVLRMEYLGIATYLGKRRRAFREAGQSRDQLHDKKRRALRLSNRDYDQALSDARIMLRNILRA